MTNQGRANAVLAAVKRIGVEQVAELLGLSPAGVYHHCRRGEFPADHCVRLEALTNGAVRAEELNDSLPWAALRANAAAA